MKSRFIVILLLYLIVSSYCYETRFKYVSISKSKNKMVFLIQLISRLAIQIIVKIASRAILNNIVRYSTRKLVKTLVKKSLRNKAINKTKKLIHSQTKSFKKRAEKNIACKKASVHLSNYYKSHNHKSKNKIIHLIKALYEAGKCANQIRNHKTGRRLMIAARKLKSSHKFRKIIKILKRKHLRKLSHISKAKTISSIKKSLKIIPKRLKSEMKKLMKRAPQSAIKLIKKELTIRRGVKFIRNIISITS